GKAVIGSTVTQAFVDQERESLEGDQTLIDEVGGGLAEITLGDRKVPIRQYLSQFGFKGASQQKKADELSGGERNRCHLAKVLKVGGNLLLLDEPTNDLDVNTLRMLEEAILDFSGCILVISHDRFFLDRVCTHLLVFEGEGRVHWYEGNFSSYQDWRSKEYGDRLFENRRNRYRKIVKA
ncbi:MAG: ATP-binding cassette domain-containing protein, partial [bacterium]|nr:ATP-binding cassette domain-containing protein [bacterium]